MDILTLLILVLVAFIASIVNAIAGGGGLITLPALFLAGLDPITSLATNKLQGTFSNSAAAYTYVRKGIIDLNDAKPMVLCGLIGGALGALSVDWLPKTWLVTMVPILLMLVSLYFSFQRKVPTGTAPRPLLSYQLGCLGIGLVLGFYDGLFGPGTGPFIMAALMGLCLIPLVRAMGLSRITNASSNFSALIVFMIQGYVNWLVGLSMMIGAISGAYVGTYCALYFGPKLIRPLLVIVSFLLAIALVWQPNHPIQMWLLSFFT